MEKFVKVSTGESKVTSSTIVSTETSSTPPTAPAKADPFFAVPSIVIGEPKTSRAADKDTLVSITF